MSNQMSFNFDIEINKESSNKNIQDYVKEVGKSGVLEANLGINTNDLMKELGKLQGYTFNMDASGDIQNITKTVVSSMGEILTYQLQLNEEQELEVVRMTAKSDKLKFQKQQYKELGDLIKERYKVEKDSIGKDEQSLKTYTSRLKELDDLIKNKDNYISQNDLLDMEEYGKLVEEVTRQEYELQKVKDQHNSKTSQAQTKQDDTEKRVKDKKYELMYTQLIKEEEEKQKQLANEKKIAFSQLVDMKKELGSLDKQMVNLSGEELKAVKEQHKEVRNKIKAQEKYIANNGLEEEKERAKVLEQEHKNMVALNREKAKSKDNLQSQQYDRLLKAIEKEYQYKKKLINASEEEVDLLNKKIKATQSIQASSNTRIWRNGLKDENLDKTVAQMREWGKQEIQILETKKKQDNELKKQKSTYEELLKLEKEIGSLTKKGMNAGGEEKGAIYTQLIEKSIEFETRSNELKKLGLVDEQKELELLGMRKKVQNEILILEAQQIDKDNVQNQKAKEYVELAQRGLALDLKKLQSGRNGRYTETEEIDGLIKRIEKLNKLSTQDARKEITNLKQDIKELTYVANDKRLKDTGDGVNILGTNIKRLTGYVSGAMLIRQLWREIGNGVSYVKDLNSAFTDLNITMDISKNQFNELVGRATNLAKNNGIATSSVLEMAKTYANSTTSISDVMDKLQGTVALTNVAGMSAGESTSAVQSVLNQFKLVEEGSMSVSQATERMGDVIVAVSKSMAYDFQKGTRELISGINEAGSAMYASGMDLESYASILGTLIEITGRSGSEVANSMKMLSARILQVKELADAEGVQEEEMAKAEKLLARYNVTIRDSVGNMKPLQDILREFAPIYAKMSDAEQQMSAELLAGNRHRSTFTALMNNMSRELQLYNEAQGSSGVLMQANEKYTESLQGKIGTLQATVQELYATMVNSDAVSSVLDGSIALMQMITNVADFLQGKMIPTILATTGAIVGFKFAMAGFSITDMLQYLSVCITKMFSFQQATTLATAGVMAFKTAMGGLVIGTVVSLAVGGFKAIAESIKPVNEKLDETSEKINSIKSEIETLDNVKVGYDKYIELNNQLETFNGSLEERKKLEEEILAIEQTPTGNEEYNAIIQSQLIPLEEKKVLLEDILQKEREIQAIALKDSMINKREVNDIVEQLDFATDRYYEFLDAVYNSQTQTFTLKTGGVYDIAMYNDAIEQHKETLSDAYLEAQRYNSMWEEIGQLTGEDITSNLITITDEMRNAYSEIKGIGKGLDEVDYKINSVGDAVKESARNLEQLHSLLVSESEIPLEEQFVSLGKQAQEVSELIKEINEEGLSYTSMEKVLEIIPEIGKDISNVTKVQEMLNEKFKEMEEAQNIAYQIMNENSESYFENCVKNSQEWNDYQLSSYDMLMSAHAQMLNNFGSNYNGYFENLAKSMQNDLQNAKTLAEGKAKVEATLIEGLTKAWNDYYAEQYKANLKAVGASEDRYIPMGSLPQAMKEYIQLYNNAWDNYRQIVNNLSGIKMPTFQGTSAFFDKGSSSKENEKLIKDLDDIADRYYEINNALSDVNNQLQLNQTKQKNATGQAYLDLLEEEIYLMKEKQKLLAEQRKEMEKESTVLGNALKDNGFKFDSKGNISNYQQRVKELQNWANSKSGEDKEKAIETVENLMDMIERYTELIKDEIPDVVNEWEEMTNAIKEAERQQLEFVTDVQKKITSAIENELKKRTDAVKKELQKQKDLYNEQFDEEDYQDKLSKEQRKLDEIQQQINDLSRDTSEAGKLKLQQLLAEYEAQQEAINQIIRDKEKENGNQAFDDAMDELDKELEDALSPENLAKLMNDALATGIIQIGDEVIKLDDLMSNWLDETGDGLYALGNTLRSELIDSLQQASSLMAELGTGFKSISQINPQVPNSRSLPETQKQQETRIEFNSPLLSIENIEGDLADSVLSKINNAMDRVKYEIENTLATKLSMY